MPRRETILKNGEIYHIYNKTIERKKVFIESSICNTFLNTISYYRSTKALKSYSSLQLMLEPQRKAVTELISFRKYFKVEILVFCLMPTHYHLLLKQKTEYGIQKFMTDIINSFTRYFNIKTSRKGPLFLPRFKLKLIETDEQLMHVSRYIHLNPYSSGDIKKIEDLLDYPYSSFKDYISDTENQLIQRKYVLELFKNDKQRYKKFVLQNAEYQQTLSQAKYADKFLNK